MAGELFRYDPALVTIFFGPIRISSFDEGTFVRVTRARETWEKRVGRDGETIRVRSKNRTGSFEFRLHPGAREHDFLSLAHIVDEQTEVGIVPCFMFDNNGRELALGVRSWLVGWPDMEKAIEADQPVTWRVDSDFVRMYRGGLALAE